jgi:hypothetical protein
MILSILMEKLDERQNLENLTQKIISSPEIDLIFREVESEINALAIDPVWCHLDELEKDVSDRRNLKEKIEAVCPSYPIRKINLHSRVACRSKTEQNASNKSFLSLRYRVHEACQEHLVNANTSELNEDKIDLLFEELKNKSINNIDNLKTDYTYTISNKTAINGIVMNLFDGCFLALDTGENDE